MAFTSMAFDRVAATADASSGAIPVRRTACSKVSPRRIWTGIASGAVRPAGNAGGDEGLIRKGRDLGLGERRSLFRFRGLVYATGKQRHRDRSHRRQGVGRDAHRLATWIELSHRSPTNDDADRRQSHW